MVDWHLFLFIFGVFLLILLVQQAQDFLWGCVIAIGAIAYENVVSPALRGLRAMFKHQHP